MDAVEMQALRLEGADALTVRESLTREAALQIKINGRPYTLTMRSPGGERNLAFGLLLTEGIIRSAGEVQDCLVEPSAGTGSVQAVDMRIDPALLQGKNLFNRTLLSNAACGVCGKTDIGDLPAEVDPIDFAGLLAVGTVHASFAAMRRRQEDFSATGGCHAAAAFSQAGEALSVQEDIGRHNAVDKVVGALLLENALGRSALLTVSGRLSFEIAAKCAAARIPVLAAVSAPSTLAVELCRDAGITLLAFCRGERATVYTHPERIAEIPRTHRRERGR